MNQIHSNDFSQEVTEMSSQKYPATILQNRMSLSLCFHDSVFFHFHSNGYCVFAVTGSQFILTHRLGKRKLHSLFLLSKTDVL